MANNHLCGLDGTYIAKGITKLCEALKGSAVTSLKCAAAPVSAFLPTPLDMLILSPFPTLPLARSLGVNNIGAKGAFALAAILKKTQITNLGCAAARECLLLCECPLTLPTLCSLAGNKLCGINRYGNGTYTAEGITKLCEGLKGSSVTSLMCAVGLSVCLSVNSR